MNIRPFFTTAIASITVALFLAACDDNSNTGSELIGSWSLVGYIDHDIAHDPLPSMGWTLTFREDGTYSMHQTFPSDVSSEDGTWSVTNDHIVFSGGRMPWTMVYLVDAGHLRLNIAEMYYEFELSSP